MSSRRNSLSSFPFSPQSHPHAGLWFDKYLKKQKSEADKMKPYVEHIRQTGKIETPPEYIAFFSRWREGLEKMGTQLREVESVGRLAAGLGGESVIENGMTLHHTYGVPIIPGSSLKGTARAYAAANLKGPWCKDGDAFRTLFGGQIILSGKQEREKARVGIALFYDALPLPGTFGIHNEIMAVHHSDYYQGKDEAPADWDSPTPIPFSSVHGRFLIALHAPSAPVWATTGMGILQMALAEIGVGGKTSSGYGRFLPPSSNRSKQTKSRQRATADPEQQTFDNFKLRLDNLPTSNYASELGGKFVNEWRQSKLGEKHRHNMARAILDLVEGTTGKRKKQFRQKGWHQELLDGLPADDFRREQY